MKTVFALKDIARMASQDDNVAIATRRLEANTKIVLASSVVNLNATILEGHRFAIQTIKKGGLLKSWGLPFGQALSDISAGDYVANASMLETLRARPLSVTLPEKANFEDVVIPYKVDESTFQAAEQVKRYKEDLTFEGYVRSGGRGVGTRNIIILLGTSSLTGSFVKALESRFKEKQLDYPNIDGIVSVAHTEGGSIEFPNNYDLVLRTLAGFMVHPNVAAVLAVDIGTEHINNKILQDYCKTNNYALDTVKHHFMSLDGRFENDLDKAEMLVEDWLEPVNNFKRSTVSAAHLKLALQCGGSDAFSGISGNPLAAWIAKKLIHYGGSANLAETDELIGAEPYVLQKVKSIKVARQFLATIARFQARAAWHGTSAEGNPSGGNKLRGLYNIVLKSIGAANKKHPEVRLDAVIDYGEPMQESGYYFMDSPGNDLESIAGQVASGCNMIIFVTGNGSITNFPFVPTLKVVTTSDRFELLKDDMDINAGSYLDGSDMDDIGQASLNLFLNVASGQKSVGEKAGHAQVQLWRNWQQNDKSKLNEVLNQAKPSGQPIILNTADQPEVMKAFDRQTHIQHEQLGLILPTSLCSGQIAAQIAQNLNARQLGRSKGISHFVALHHTEGCGVSGDGKLATRTLLNYLRHPRVKHALLLEHGCEKTHNDFMRNRLQELGMSADEFGWASIQLDGGINQVTNKAETWFTQKIMEAQHTAEAPIKLSSMRLGIASREDLPEWVASLFFKFSQEWVAAGGTTVFVENDPLLKQRTLRFPSEKASLAYGQFSEQAGLHIMQCPTTHWVETLTGLGATGVELVLLFDNTNRQQVHPFIPVLQFSSNHELVNQYDNAELLTPGTTVDELLELVKKRISLDNLTGSALNSDFQMTRGLLDISL